MWYVVKKKWVDMRAWVDVIDLSFFIENENENLPMAMPMMNVLPFND